MSTILHTPEQLNSTACAIADGPLGQLFIQCLDAYGFQRELVVRSNGADVTIITYQHPARRDVQSLSTPKGRDFVEILTERITRYPENLFGTCAGRGRCSGFVHLCEALHRGTPALDALKL